MRRESSSPSLSVEGVNEVSPLEETSAAALRGVASVSRLGGGSGKRVLLKGLFRPDSSHT